MKEAGLFETQPRQYLALTIVSSMLFGVCPHETSLSAPYGELLRLQHVVGAPMQVGQGRRRLRAISATAATGLHHSSRLTRLNPTRSRESSWPVGRTVTGMWRVWSSRLSA